MIDRINALSEQVFPKLQANRSRKILKNDGKDNDISMFEIVQTVNEDGKVVTEGSQVQLGGNDIYKVVCRKHFRELTNLI